MSGILAVVRSELDLLFSLFSYCRDHTDTVPWSVIDWVSILLESTSGTSATGMCLRDGCLSAFACVGFVAPSLRGLG